MKNWQNPFSYNSFIYQHFLKISMDLNFLLKNEENDMLYESYFFKKNCLSLHFFKTDVIFLEIFDDIKLKFSDNNLTTYRYEKK